MQEYRAADAITEFAHGNDLHALVLLGRTHRSWSVFAFDKINGTERRMKLLNYMADLLMNTVRNIKEKKNLPFKYDYARFFDTDDEDSYHETGTRHTLMELFKKQFAEATL